MATKKKPPKPEWTDVEKLEFTQKIGELEDTIRVQEQSVARTSKKLKAEKEILNGSVSEMRRMVFELHHPEAIPLFTNSNGHAEKKDKPAAVAEMPTNDGWKVVPIRDALKGLGKKVYEGMEKAQLNTIGEVIDWKNAKAERWWTDLEGVGKAACDKIDDAIERFFTEQKEKTLQNADAAPLNGDGDTHDGPTAA